MRSAFEALDTSHMRDVCPRRSREESVPPSGRETFQIRNVWSLLPVLALGVWGRGLGVTVGGRRLFCRVWGVRMGRRRKGT
jgi:hypothetical protein